jgi:hypothetical protein
LAREGAVEKQPLLALPNVNSGYELEIPITVEYFCGVFRMILSEKHHRQGNPRIIYLGKTVNVNTRLQRVFLLDTTAHFVV